MEMIKTKVVGTIIIVLFVGFFLSILGSVTGAISGWIVGLFFGDTIIGILGQIGIHHVTMFQVGAFVGFIGGFFRAHVSLRDGPRLLAMVRRDQ